MKKNFSIDEIMEVLDKYSKNTMDRKNKYIALNGIDEKVNDFDCELSACVSIMCEFDRIAKN